MEFMLYTTLYDEDLIQHKDPDILFLQETKLPTKKVEAIKIRLGFTCYLGVDCEGRGGGLAFLWNSNTELTVMYFLKSHIQIEIRYENSPQSFTSLHGHPMVA